MRISTDYNNRVNFTSLKISYDAEERLHHVSKEFISGIFEAGKKLEHTEYLDLIMLKNLSFRIKEKANKFFVLREPIWVDETPYGPLKVTGTYDGLEDESHKKGQKIDILVDCGSEVKNHFALKKIKGLNGIMRLSYITKMIDDFKIRQAEPDLTNQSRDKEVSLLMYKYADFV